MKIRLKEDFANKKKGDVLNMSNTTASNLIRRNLAERYTEETPKKRGRQPKNDK